MKITENEMRGLLNGKCVPGDMKVNEELPAYLVRKFAALQQKLDAAEKRLISVTESRDQWEANAHEFSRCADRLEARLAELEKQEPIFQIEVSGNHWLNAGPVDNPDFTGLPDGINQLYARPVPAINLAEMVPKPSDNKYWENEGYGTRFKVAKYHGDVLAILSNIEEATK